MQWLTENWVWIVVFIVFIGVHFLRRGGHGGGCGGGHGRERPPEKKDAPATKHHTGHQHSS